MKVGKKISKRDEVSVAARKALDHIWDLALLVGRCWGRAGRGKSKNEGNPFQGTNITLADDQDLVTVSFTENGEAVVHEFIAAKKTPLGDRVREALAKAGINVN